MNNEGNRRGRRPGHVPNSLGDLVKKAISPPEEAKRAYEILRKTYLKEVEPQEGEPVKYWKVFPPSLIDRDERKESRKGQWGCDFRFALNRKAVCFVRNLWFAHEFFDGALKVIKFLRPAKPEESERVFQERLEEIEALAETYGRWCDNAGRIRRRLRGFDPTKTDLLKLSKASAPNRLAKQESEMASGSPAVADLIREVEARASYQAGNPDDACEKALYFLALGRPEIAERIAAEVLERNPNHAIALYANAVVLLDASERHQKQAFRHDVMHPHDLPPLDAEEQYHADRHEKESLAAWEKAGRAFMLMLKAYENWPKRFGIKRYEFEPVMWQHRIEGWILRSGAARVTGDSARMGLMNEEDSIAARAALTRILSKLWKEQRWSLFDASHPERLRDFLVLASRLELTTAKECLQGLEGALPQKPAEERESFWERSVCLPVGPGVGLAEALCGALNDAEFCQCVLRVLGAVEGLKLLRRADELGKAQRLDRMEAAHTIALRHLVLGRLQPESWQDGVEVCRSMAEDYAWQESVLGKKLRSCWRYGLVLMLFESARLAFGENEPSKAAELMAKALDRATAWFDEISGEQPMVRFWECDEFDDWERMGDFFLRGPNCLAEGKASEWGAPREGRIPKMRVRWWDEFVRWAEESGQGDMPVLLGYGRWLAVKAPEVTSLAEKCKALEQKLGGMPGGA